MHKWIRFEWLHAQEDDADQVRFRLCNPQRTFTFLHHHSVQNTSMEHTVANQIDRFITDYQFDEGISSETCIE